MQIAIDKIKVGERRREDLGNIQELADSIAEHGLLQPIVVLSSTQTSTWWQEDGG